MQLENRLLTAVRSGNLRDLNNCIEVITNHEKEEKESSDQKTEQLANEKQEQEKLANEKQEQEKSINQNISENLVNQENDDQAISKVCNVQIYLFPHDKEVNLISCHSFLHLLVNVTFYSF